MDEDMADCAEVEADRCRGFSVDFDYEYDAPKYFDLSAEEPVMEAFSAEKWFDTAESYPPSPLIMKIASDEDMFSDNIYYDADADAEAQPNPSELNDVTKEETQCRIIENVTKVGFKPKVKSYASKVSTLMKPTASYLAKKTQRHETAPLINNTKLNTFKSLESSGDTKDCTIQAPKRQRLEKGHLSKATDTVQPNYIHKTRDKTDIPHANGNVGPPRLRLTIPREPDLQTMRRAERLYARRGLSNVNEPHKQHIKAEAIHKPNPSNKNEFHLTNKSRVLGDLPGAVSKAVEGCDGVSKKSENRNSQNPRPNRSSVNQKHEGRSSIFFFKADAVDKKVALFSSRNAKPQSTVPKEHKLYTGKRQQIPPPLTEVFNKLSLATGARHVSTSKTPFCVPPAHVSKVFSYIPSHLFLKPCQWAAFLHLSLSAILQN